MACCADLLPVASRRRLGCDVADRSLVCSCYLSIIAVLMRSFEAVDASRLGMQAAHIGGIGQALLCADEWRAPEYVGRLSDTVWQAWPAQLCRQM
jgi:hypothetical protein